MQEGETTNPERDDGGLTTTTEGDTGERRDLDIDVSTTCDPGLVAVAAIGLEDVPLTFPQRVRVNLSSKPYDFTTTAYRPCWICTRYG